VEYLTKTIQVLLSVIGATAGGVAKKKDHVVKRDPLNELGAEGETQALRMH
jgi:hypothetical protein